MTIVMKEMRLYGRPSLNEVNDMSGKNPGMDMTTLGALAEPNRMNIVELLRDGPLTVGEIADRLGLRQPQASKHLKVLSDNGIVEVQAAANRRIYKLRTEPFQALDFLGPVLPACHARKIRQSGGLLAGTAEQG